MEESERMDSLAVLIRPTIGNIPAEITPHRKAGGILKPGVAVFVSENDTSVVLGRLRGSFQTRWHSPTCIICTEARGV